MFGGTPLAETTLAALKGMAASVAGFAFTYGIALFIVGSAIELGYDLFKFRSTNPPASRKSKPSSPVSPIRQRAAAAVS